MRLTALLLLFLTVSAWNVVALPMRQQPVNAVLGDISFVKTFGSLPTAQTNEQLRISTHLAYVEQMLRQADVRYLSVAQQKKRAFLLDKLREYRIAARFPKNIDYAGERRPCFIDKYGNICAVGYLLAVDAGQEVAEYVNAQAQYAYLHDMKIAVLDEWVEQSGLSKIECAMIQPGYQDYIPDPVFTIESMTPTSTSANGRVFDIEFIVDGIPTTATATTNPFTQYSFGAALLPPDAPLYTVEWFNQHSVRLYLVNFYLSNSRRYPGKTQGTIKFQVNGASLRIMPYQVFIYYREPIPPRVGVFHQKNYYASQPGQLDVQPGTSDIRHTSASEFTVFPHPITTKVEIQSPSKILKLRLCTINGVEVFTKQDVGNENLNVVDVSALPSGVYFLEVHSGKGIKVQKLVKH